MNTNSGIADLVHAILADPACAAIYVDSQGRIRSWNPAAEAMLGYTAEQAIGCRADLIVPEELRAMHWDGFDRAVATDWPGSNGWGAIEPMHQEGHLVQLEVNLLPIRSPKGSNLAGILALYRRS